MKRTTIGLDLAKRVFQVHAVDANTGEMERVALKRSQVLRFFVNREPCIVAMEACGSAQHWARELVKQGHEVRLIAAQFVRPFVKTNKTDAADAEGIWEAAQRPGMRYVALKSEEQQAMLGLHRLREQRVKMRSMLVNQLHGLMAEYGVALPKGWAVMLKQAGELLADEERSAIPALLRAALLEQIEQVRALSGQIKSLERRIGAWQRRAEDCQRIAAIPGVGLLTATAAVATMGDARSFRSGREFAAFLGLVPRQSGTGGRVKLLGISKRGDRYLRTLLIHGARTVLSWQRRPGRELDPWLKQLLARRALNVVVVALANKMARMIWALLAHGRTFQRGYGQAPACTAA
ncbi:MAG: IS110 family transposase [Steroidobacteraceae bacterium]